MEIFNCARVGALTLFILKNDKNSKFARTHKKIFNCIRHCNFNSAFKTNTYKDPVITMTYGKDPVINPDLTKTNDDLYTNLMTLSATIELKKFLNLLMHEAAKLKDKDGLTLKNFFDAFEFELYCRMTYERIFGISANDSTLHVSHILDRFNQDIEITNEEYNSLRHANTFINELKHADKPVDFKKLKENFYKGRQILRDKIYPLANF